MAGRLAGLAALGCARDAAARARRLARHAAALEAEVERLQDRTWRLAESEERYRSLIEAQLDVIVQRDRAGASPSPMSASPSSWERPARR